MIINSTLSPRNQSTMRPASIVHAELASRLRVVRDGYTGDVLPRTFSRSHVARIQRAYMIALAILRAIASESACKFRRTITTDSDGVLSIAFVPSISNVYAVAVIVIARLFAAGS